MESKISLDIFSTPMRHEINSIIARHQCKIPNKFIWELHKIHDAILVIEPGLDGIIINDRNELLDIQSRFIIKNNAGSNLFSGDTINISHDVTPKKILKNVFIGFDTGWHNYYHWIILTLPRIKMAQGIFSNYKNNFEIEYVVPDYNGHQNVKRPPAFSGATYRESINLFDMPEKITQLECGFYKIDTAYLLKPTCQKEFDSVYSNNIINILNSLNADAVTRKKSDFPQKIYISRGDSIKRNIDSYDHNISKILCKNGFTSLNFSKIQFHDQIKLMKNADTVASIHGSGLTNIIFMKKESKVIEFSNTIGMEKEVRPHFYNLARIRGINYGFVLYNKNINFSQLEDWIAQF